MKNVATLLANLKMTTQEVANLTGKSVKNINRDVNEMLKKLEKAGVDTSGALVERDGRGYIKSISLDRNLTFTLVTGYDVALRHAVITKWTHMEEQVAKHGYYANDNEWYRLDDLIVRFCQMTGAKNPLANYRDDKSWAGNELLSKLVSLHIVHNYLHVVDPTQADMDDRLDYETVQPAQFFFLQRVGMFDTFLHIFGIECVHFCANLKHDMATFLDGIRVYSRKELTAPTLFRELRKVQLMGRKRSTLVLTSAEYDELIAKCDAEDLDYPTDVEIID